MEWSGLAIQDASSLHTIIYWYTLAGASSTALKGSLVASSDASLQWHPLVSYWRSVLPQAWASSLLPRDSPSRLQRRARRPIGNYPWTAAQGLEMLLNFRTLWFVVFNFSRLRRWCATGPKMRGVFKETSSRFGRLDFIKSHAAFSASTYK